MCEPVWVYVPRDTAGSFFLHCCWNGEKGRKKTKKCLAVAPPFNVPSGFGEIETSTRGGGGGELYPSCVALQTRRLLNRNVVKLFRRFMIESFIYNRRRWRLLELWLCVACGVPNIGNVARCLQNNGRSNALIFDVGMKSMWGSSLNMIRWKGCAAGCRQPGSHPSIHPEQRWSCGMKTERRQRRRRGYYGLMNTERRVLSHTKKINSEGK